MKYRSLLCLPLLLYLINISESSKSRFVILSTAEPVNGSLVTQNAAEFVHEETNVNVSVQKGSTAHLHCKISGLQDQSVSWYKRKGDEIHLITVGFQTYHNDERFSLIYDHPNDWRLRIRYVQDRDEGTYECQVSSHPPLIRMVHLHVVVPTIRILDDRGEVFREKFYRTGSTIELQCQVTNVPTATSLQLSWHHGTDRLNYDASRGGVSVKTELRGTIARSWLRVADAKIEDSGTYFCNVSDLSAIGVEIHIVPEKYPAAIQGSSYSTNVLNSVNLLIPFVVMAIGNNEYLYLFPFR